MRYRPTPSAPRSRQWAGFVGKLDVAEQGNTDAVACLRRQVAQFAQSRLERAECAAGLLVLLQGLLVWIEDEDTLIAVNDYRVASGHVRDEIAQANHCRNFQNAGHDGRVAGPASSFGCESMHQVAVEGSRLAGTQIMSQYNDRDR